jgi:DNA-binding NarL/FixJ family response regulator
VIPLNPDLRPAREPRDVPAGDPARELGAPVLAAPATPDPLRIVLVDDHPLVREGLRLVLSADADLRVVGEAGTPDAGFLLVERERPDVLVLDLTLGDDDAIPLIHAVTERIPTVRILVVTMHRDGETVRQALLAGAAGYLVKGAHGTELKTAIRAVARGERYLHSSVTAIVVDDSLRWLQSGERLSIREREILVLLAADRSAEWIARQLGISPHTVRRHVANIGEKLEIRGRTGLVAYAREHDLTRPAS